MSWRTMNTSDVVARCVREGLAEVARGKRPSVRASFGVIASGALLRGISAGIVVLGPHEDWTAGPL